MKLSQAYSPLQVRKILSGRCGYEPCRRLRVDGFTVCRAHWALGLTLTPATASEAQPLPVGVCRECKSYPDEQGHGELCSLWMPSELPPYTDQPDSNPGGAKID